MERPLTPKNQNWTSGLAHGQAILLWGAVGIGMLGVLVNPLGWSVAVAQTREVSPAKSAVQNTSNKKAGTKGVKNKNANAKNSGTKKTLTVISSPTSRQLRSTQFPTQSSPIQPTPKQSPKTRADRPGASTKNMITPPSPRPMRPDPASLPIPTPSPTPSPIPSLALSPAPPTLGGQIEDTATEGKMFMSKVFRSFSSEIDSIFSSRRTSYLTNKSQFRAGYLATVREYDGVSGDAQISFNFALPETEKKAQLVIERKPRGLDKAEAAGEVGRARPLGEDQQSQTAATLRYFMFESEFTSLASDMGVQLENPIQPFGRFRISHSKFPTEPWELRISEEIYFFFIDRWKLVTTLDSDHTLSPDLLFRLGHDLTWFQLKNSFDLVYGPSLFQKLSKTRALGYHIKYLAKSVPQWQNINLTVSVVFRQLIFRDWFFYELIPAVDFPRTRDWHSTPSFSIKLEAIF